MNTNIPYPEGWPPSEAPQPSTSSSPPNAGTSSLWNERGHDLQVREQEDIISSLWSNEEPSIAPDQNSSSTSRDQPRYTPYNIPSTTTNNTSPHLDTLQPFSGFNFSPSTVLPSSQIDRRQSSVDHTDRQIGSTDHSRIQGKGGEKGTTTTTMTSAEALANESISADTHGTKRRSFGRAPYSNEGSSGGDTIGGTGGSDQTSGKKLVKKADKSCRVCRERRVRCDRNYPSCDRCRKRRETCEYVESVHVEEIEEGGTTEVIATLTTKINALEKQLASALSNPPNPSPASRSTRPLASVPTERTRQLPHESPIGLSPSLDSSSSNTSGSSRNNSRTPPSPSDSSSSTITSSIGDIYSNQLRFSSDEAETLTSFVMEQNLASKNLGRSNLNWRLGEPAVTRQLTIHLMEAANRACCAKIPGIKPLADRIDHYKRNLDKLDGPGQCAVAVLSALGARASPHSALLGIATTSLADGTPSLPLFLYAGERREMACRILERRARDVCWQHGMLDSNNTSDLDAIIGLTQLLIFESDEETLPKHSRLFSRVAVGMYHDIRFKALERGERTSRDPRIGPGTALFLADAIVSASSSLPSFISTAELATYFASDGVIIPDFSGSTLAHELDKILQAPLDREKLVDALTAGAVWVSGCARLFAQLTMTRRTNAPSPLPLLRNLWSIIDNVHNSLQHLQTILINLDVSQVADLPDTPYAMDYFVLLGVRADATLVDLINLMHIWLKKDRNGLGIWTEREDDPLLETMREESELRVRKCLKLSAFYAQLFLSSQDKHLVHHMMMQLEVLTYWSDWAVQRVGTEGGPTTEEYEITESELDWFQRALELSCYYTPKAANRLQRFTAARNAAAQSPPSRSSDQFNALTMSFDDDQPAHMAYRDTLFQDQQTGYDSNDKSSNDHNEMYPLAGGWVSNPSQIFVFDDYGISSQQGVPPGTSPPVAVDPTFTNSFTGQSWMGP